MNSDTNIAVHLSIEPNVNGQQKLTCFIDFLLVSGRLSLLTC